MKANLIYQIRKPRFFFFITFCIIFIESSFTQSWHSLQVSSQTTGPGLYQSNSSTRNYFRIGDFSGIGGNSPNATFHLRDYITDPYVPMFENDARNANEIIGSIKHIILTDTGFYGIWQQGSNFSNYFEGGIFCNSSLNFNGRLSGINISKQDDQFTFHYSISAPGSPIRTPFKINYYDVPHS
ncbi:MAG: hypothetical protein NTU98_03235 [Bacteroidetes bacterium]|nr:hypothetical protein [Bacteroidota bacterium]